MPGWAFSPVKLTEMVPEAEANTKPVKSMRHILHRVQIGGGVAGADERDRERERSACRRFGGCVGCADDTAHDVGVIGIEEQPDEITVDGPDAAEAVAILESRSDVALMCTDIQMPGQMAAWDLRMPCMSAGRQLGSSWYRGN